jgi:hypothetical protein
MNVTPNHRALSRAHLAEAHALAGAGELDRARARLRSAADHALRALAASTGPGTRDAPLAVAATGGGAPVLLRPDEAVDPLGEIVAEDELDAGFERVQRLIDAALGADPIPPPATLPLYGGAAGMLNARGAEAAERVLVRVWAAIRGRPAAG